MSVDDFTLTVVINDNLLFHIVYLLCLFTFISLLCISHFTNDRAFQFGLCTSLNTVSHIAVSVGVYTLSDHQHSVNFIALSSNLLYSY